MVAGLPTADVVQVSCADQDCLRSNVELLDSPASQELTLDEVLRAVDLLDRNDFDFDKFLLGELPPERAGLGMVDPSATPDYGFSPGDATTLAKLSLGELLDSDESATFGKDLLQVLSGEFGGSVDESLIRGEMDAQKNDLVDALVAAGVTSDQLITLGLGSYFTPGSSGNGSDTYRTGGVTSGTYSADAIASANRGSGGIIGELAENAVYDFGIGEPAEDLFSSPIGPDLGIASDRFEDISTYKLVLKEKTKDGNTLKVYIERYVPGEAIAKVIGPDGRSLIFVKVRRDGSGYTMINHKDGAHTQWETEPDGKMVRFKYTPKTTIKPETSTPAQNSDQPKPEQNGKKPSQSPRQDRAPDYNTEEFGGDPSQLLTIRNQFADPPDESVDDGFDAARLAEAIVARQQKVININPDTGGDNPPSENAPPPGPPPVVDPPNEEPTIDGGHRVGPNPELIVGPGVPETASDGEMSL